MKKQFRTIVIIIGVIIIPILFYGYSQMLSLSDDEQMAEKIYQRQMETVLFSLNQYADDMMSAWARALAVKESPIHQNAEELVLSNESIRFLILTELSTQENSIFYSDYVSKDELDGDDVNRFLTENDSLLNKLAKYMEADFQKIQAMEWQTNDSLNTKELGVTFMLYNRDSSMYNATIFLEEEYWAEGVLGGKMQKIATDNFGLAILYDNAESIPRVLYNTGNFEILKNYVESKLWILPNIRIAIQSSGENYADLIRARSRNNLVLLVLTILIMLIGIIVIINNVRGALKNAELKSDFVANVSHEIRTPLSLIRMYSETLLLGRITSEEKKTQYYNVIFQESGRLTYLVNNILDFSRIEANRKTYQMEKCSLNDIVRSVYDQYSYAFQDKQIQSNLILDDGDINILADKQAVEEAISNLIDNAIKYNDSDIKIEISTNKDDKFAYCDVIDSGVGIPVSEQNKIFEKFYRLEGALTQKTKGTGLGLSLVKHIMIAHKGEVKLKSKTGKGSTFTLIFPIETKDE
jgi:two-component system phosphate regulon sensor histidine kinase PhoR